GVGGQRWFDRAARGGELGLSAGTSATMLGAQVAQPCRQGAQEGRLVCGPGGSDLSRSESWRSRAGVSALGEPLAEAAAPGGSLCGARLGGAPQLLLRSPISLEEGAYHQRDRTRPSGGPTPHPTHVQLHQSGQL